MRLNLKINRLKHNSLKGYLIFMLVSLGGLLEELIILSTFGLIECDIRAWLLFDVFPEEY